MNKLKNKVFWVIFGMLTLFLISILGIFNLQVYKSEKENIRNNLMRMPMERNIIKDPIRDIPEEDEFLKNKVNPQIFMDRTVYVALLGNNGEVKEVINHSQNSDITDNKIKEIAEDIVKNSNKKMNISNLYFDNYSYAIKNDTILVIMDNAQSKDRLLEILRSSILIFILLEVIIVYISIELTKWIIKPVIDTFNKQKQFIADASHELKTPLAVVIASADALEREPNENKWLDNIKSESERMNQLVSDLLDMAKLENDGKQQYKTEYLSKIIERSVLTFESLIYEKNLKLNYNIQENLSLNCDSNQIKQLMAILLDNAIKHSSKDGDIVVDLKKEKNNIILCVKNKGREIPKEDRDRIFERFYRGDESRNRNENRYGLGLAIAKNIVENHNGKICVNCSEGYTSFIITMKM